MKLFAVWMVVACAVGGAPNNARGAAPGAGACAPPTPPSAITYTVVGADRNDLVPVGLETFNSPRQLIEGASPAAGPEVLRRPAELRRRSGAGPTVGRSNRHRKYLPVILSLLVPGAGEAYMGYYKRGTALMAAEATAWTGYAYYHGKGLDSRRDFEHFADRHWTIQRWIDNHPEVYPLTGQTLADIEDIGRSVSGSGAWPGYVPWVSRAEDKQHYYENIGKYDWYISGWEDFDPTLNPFPRNTSIRDQYRSMRMESNDQLDNANRFVYISLAARVFSLVETVLLVRRSEAGNAALEVNGVRLGARPRGTGGGEVSLEVRF